jgi:hypothetical protein
MPGVSRVEGAVAYFVDLPPFTSFLLHEPSVDGWHDLIELCAVISTTHQRHHERSHKFCVLHC